MSPPSILHLPVRPMGPQLICDTITNRDMNGHLPLKARDSATHWPCGRASGMSGPRLNRHRSNVWKGCSTVGDEPQTDKWRYMTTGVANRHQK
jgi:hypothetical protein